MAQTLTFSQIKTVWMNASDGTPYHTEAWSALMAAIAMAESGGSPTAKNAVDNNGTQTSWGLWQISLGNHSAPASNWSDPNENAKLAIAKLNTQGLSAWGTYTSGAFKQFLSPTQSLPPGQGTTNATLTGLDLNPVTWFEAPIKGLEWAGKFAYGQSIGKISTDVEGLASISQSLGGMVTAVSKIGELFLLLFRPAFWLRVGAFFVGLLALYYGVQFMRESL